MLRALRQLALTVLLVLSAPALAAQQAGPPGPPADRDSLESRVRMRMAQVFKRQLGLNDEQMRRLAATNQRFAAQRRELLVKERQIRVGLRDEIELGDSTRDPQIARLLDDMSQVQRRRLDLMDAEQKELATFMTPSQRARYLGMEEQIRRRVDEMREQGTRERGDRMPQQRGGAGARRPGGAPGGAPGGRSSPPPRTTRPPA
jgi:hypothetical protein